METLVWKSPSSDPRWKNISILNSILNTLSFPRGRHFPRKNRFICDSLSSKDLFHNEGIILVPLRWTNSFAKGGGKNCTAYSKWGLKKLLYKCSTSLISNENLVFMKPIILFFYTFSFKYSLHCWEITRLDATVTQTSFTEWPVITNTAYFTVLYI